MPLTSNVGENIKKLRSENSGRSKKRSRKQILAIALDVARRKGGHVSKMPMKKKGMMM